MRSQLDSFNHFHFVFAFYFLSQFLSVQTVSQSTVILSPEPSTMLLTVYNTLLVLVLTLSSSVTGDDPTVCRHDACLQSFERNREQAEAYCAAHPNRFQMGPAPSWAGECRGFGRLNNKRQRLASACSCLHEAEPTNQATSLAELNEIIAISTTPSIAVAATSMMTASSILVPTTPGPSISDVAAATSALPSPGITTTTSVDGLPSPK